MTPPSRRKRAPAVDTRSDILLCLLVELTSRHKAYLLVLGLAGVALCVDRFLLLGDATSPSKASATMPSPDDPELKTVTAPSPPASPRLSLAQRMDELAAMDVSSPLNEVSNAFVPEWDLGGASTSTHVPTPATRESAAWLKLTSVVPGRAAILNGIVVFVGKESAVPTNPDDRALRVGGESKVATRPVVLLRAEERRVVVRVGDEELELSLPDHADLQKPRGAEESDRVSNPARSGDPR